MMTKEEEWAIQNTLELKAHYLCSRNGYERPDPLEAESVQKFLKEEKLYNERFRYYYGQLSLGKMQVL